MNILLVEDDLALGQALARALQQETLAVTWVRRLQEARRFLAGEGYDALLLDLGLPDGDGLDWLKTLRASGQQLPVLILTARDDLDSRLTGLREGADDYLVKPFAIPELLARLHAVARRSSGFACDLWQLGALKVDSQARRVWLAEREISLSPSEFTLLMELIRRSGKVVTKDYLLERLYRDSDHGSDNALEVHICNLRRKLGADSIHTIRGVGYLMGKS